MGILIMVFAGLDATFNNVEVSKLVLLGWFVGGFLALLAGIYADPEVRK